MDNLKLPSKYYSSAFLCKRGFSEFDGGRSDSDFLWKWGPFVYYEKSSHAVGLLPKHGFSMLPRKSGKDSILWMVAKRALSAQDGIVYWDDSFHLLVESFSVWFKLCGPIFSLKSMDSLPSLNPYEVLVASAPVALVPSAGCYCWKPSLFSVTHRIAFWIWVLI